jgi:6-phosphogluconolactonase
MLSRRALIVTSLLTFATLVPPDGATQAEDANPQTFRVYVGTYTGAKSKGIYLLELDTNTGLLTPKGLAGEAVNPSFLAVHPNKRFLYAVGEVASVGGTKGGGVSAFAIDAASGKLTLLNQHSTIGSGPCHLVVDKEGRHVLAANYGGGSVTVLPIQADGLLKEASCHIEHQGSSVNKQRQEKPHAHSINLDAASRFAFAADLGLDKVLIYRFDSGSGKLTPNDPDCAKVAAGSGPRHFTFHPSGKFAYVINEMLLTVTAFAYDSAKGELRELQTIPTTPDGVKPGYSTAEVVVHPTGKFLYGSNRGHDSIAMFSIDPSSGKLTALGTEPTRGKTPRNFNIEPSGRFLLAANQGSDTIAVFRIDASSGKLTAVGQPVEVPSPVCVKFLPLASGTR